MGAVVLKAEVLFAGEGCPVCGEKKTARARTCRTCYEVLGNEITRRVDAVRRADIAAENGHLASQNTATPVARDVIWGPILAQVKIGRDASFCIPSRNGVGSYWDCRKNIKGGYVSLFVFGADEHKTETGERITALVELKTKTKVVKGGQVYYLRAQAVEGVKTNVKLVVGQYDHANYIQGLPSTQIVEQGRRFSVGFVNI